jgi:hypothetical protein
MSPRRASTPRQRDWLTVSGNVTLTLTLSDASAFGAGYSRTFVEVTEGQCI